MSHIMKFSWTKDDVISLDKTALLEQLMNQLLFLMSSDQFFIEKFENILNADENKIEIQKGRSLVIVESDLGKTLPKTSRDRIKDLCTTLSRTKEGWLREKRTKS